MQCTVFQTKNNLMKLFNDIKKNLYQFYHSGHLSASS